MARRFLVILASVSLMIAAAPPTRAQPAELDVALIRQPVWHAPGDSLAIRLRLSNPGPTAISGYIVTVAAHARVLSRSELHDSFEVPATFQASLITAIDASDEEIPAGGRVVREIDQPVDELQSIALTSESGVYPLTVSVLDRSGAVLASVSTQLIYYPTPPEFRLPAVPVVPIAAVPRRDPDGTFGSSPLDEAVGPGGWLSGLVAALDATTTPPPQERVDGGDGRADRASAPRDPQPDALHVGLVVMPRLAEELADMANGFRRDDDDGETTSAEARNVLSSLQRVAGRRSVQSILSPYSFPDLPTLFRPVLHQTSPIAAEHLKQHLREAEVVLAQTVGKAPTRRWIYTPDGRLNHVSLEQLQQLDAARFALFAEESLEGLDDPTGGGCPEAPLSFTCAITVSTSSGRSTGYVLDSGIQDRIEELAGPDGGRSALQRLFAETAMIREEVPSRTDRIVAIGLPPLWEPRPRLTKLLFRGFRDAPWLQTFTPRQGLARLAKQVEPSERRIRFVVPRLVNEPPDDYFEQIVEAHEIIEAFRTVQPPQSLLQRLTRTTLVGESRLWWTDPVLLLQGERYAAEAADAGQRELDKITVGGSDEITLTSRRAEIPVEVFNDANYDVSVTVRIRSSDLRLDETFARTVQAQGLHQLSVDVAAPSSGIFTVFVTVETPNGRRIDGKEVQVRSTEFNEIALGLTFGALAFLVLFYITRAIRNRRGPEAETTP